MPLVLSDPPIDGGRGQVIHRDLGDRYVCAIVLSEILRLAFLAAPHFRNPLVGEMPTDVTRAGNAQRVEVSCVAADDFCNQACRVQRKTVDRRSSQVVNVALQPTCGDSGMGTVRELRAACPSATPTITNPPEVLARQAQASATLSASSRSLLHQLLISIFSDSTSSAVWVSKSQMIFRIGATSKGGSFSQPGKRIGATNICA